MKSIDFGTKYVGFESDLIEIHHFGAKNVGFESDLIDIHHFGAKICGNLIRFH